MTGMKTLFPRSSFVGFDHLFNELEFTAKHAQDHYPPHNIIKTSDEDYLIELAVAGFSPKGIVVEVHQRTLTVTGEHVKQGREYVHRGISTKKFKRTFRLPEEMRPRKINIGKNEESNNDYNSQLLTETDGNHPGRTTL